SCHGGALVTAKVLESCLRAGARPARPGEFTERAYLNGRIDLTQAEAVIDFPEEGISADDTETIRKRLVSLQSDIDKLIATADTGRILREGLRVVIFG